MHIGNVRTALFAWLFARANKGKFILRIEDTDQSRSTDEYIQAILNDLKWIGLDYDEFHRQTERADIHRQLAQQLLQEGKAYRCYCTPEQLEQRRKEMSERSENIGYDRRCRDLAEQPQDVPCALRLKIPLEGVTEFDDLVFGKVAVQNKEIEDLVILRSDGSPTFNFACALDDHAMGITHVIRGDDHVANTPKQINILRAFGYPIPQYAHLSSILGPDKARLSKRHGATALDWYRQNGYLPDAMVNYLVRLGWAFGDEEFFRRQDLIEKFSLDHINRSAAVFNPEKLLWLNGEHIRSTTPADLWHLWKPFVLDAGLAEVVERTEGVLEGVYLCPSQWGEKAEFRPAEWVFEVMQTLQPRAKTLVEMTQRARFYFVKDIQFDEVAVAKNLKPEAKVPMQDLIQGLEGLSEPWQQADLENLFGQIIERHGIKMVKLAMPVRVGLTGESVSPGIFEIVKLLGRALSLERLQKAMERI